MGDRDEIIKAIAGSSAELKKLIDDNHKKFEITLFGENGSGGIMRNVIEVQGILYGVKNVPDDRGILGKVNDLDVCINGKNGIKTKVQRTEIKQGIWNLSLIGLQILTWAKMLFGIGPDWGE